MVSIGADWNTRGSILALRGNVMVALLGKILLIVTRSATPQNYQELQRQSLITSIT